MFFTNFKYFTRINLLTKTKLIKFKKFECLIFKLFIFLNLYLILS
jgi:hypothetical protein